MYFLPTPRVGFRLWNKNVIVLASALWGDPEVMYFIDARYRVDATQIEQKLDTELKLQELHNMQYWPIFLIDNGQHVGCCGLRPKEVTARIFEFGVHLRKAYWITGLAAEAGHAAINYAFENLQARQLFAGHHPGNHRSRRLLEKFGFVSVNDQLYTPTGLKHPSYILMQPTSIKSTFTQTQVTADPDSQPKRKENDNTRVITLTITDKSNTQQHCGTQRE